MRRFAISLSCLVFVLGACGSAKKEVSTSTSTTPASSVATSTTRATSTSTSLSVATTTSEACPNTGSTGPRATATAQPAALLTKVAVTNAGCRDSVTFTFKTSGSAVPSCKVEYRPGPFSQDGSGKSVAVAGAAFVSVRCEPAYGYDFASGTTTYTGPKRVMPTGTRHVREVVETGDFEAVLNWVIGLDGPRSFGITAGGVPTRQLVITFS
jgi:hypothetical protein